MKYLESFRDIFRKKKKAPVIDNNPIRKYNIGDYVLVNLYDNNDHYAKVLNFNDINFMNNNEFVNIYYYTCLLSNNKEVMALNGKDDIGDYRFSRIFIIRKLTNEEIKKYEFYMSANKYNL